MTYLQADDVYFARRARQSHEAAASATDIGPTSIHSSLALAYDGLAHAAETSLMLKPTGSLKDAAAAEEWDNEGGASSDAAIRTN